MSERSFSEVRALLHEPRDEDTWSALCVALEALSESALKGRYLPYIQALLEPWPEALRCVPWRWLELASQGDRRASLLIDLCRTLDLSWRPLKRAVLTRLLGALGRARPLRQLYLDSCRLSPSALALIARCEAFSEVRVLSLRHNPLSRDGAAALAESASALRSLRELDLEACLLDDESLSVLLTSGPLSRLEALDLSANALGLEAMERLSQAPQRATLKLLNLSGCVQPRGRRHGAGGPLLGALSRGVEPWPHLRQLELARWGLRASDVALLKGPLLRSGQLRVLDLNANALGERGALALSRLEALCRLEVLDLGRNLIGERGALALIGPGSRLEALRHVDLRYNALVRQQETLLAFEAAQVSVAV